ncbi:hypothetical protein K456DRAFT_53040 [Colletotrichum gloeosporioides 23]|nr:hypothetical protein K456DRAFT_53040 [Colletotrichum gloeosporioides 23]
METATHSCQLQLLAAGYMFLVCLMYAVPLSWVRPPSTNNSDNASVPPSTSAPSNTLTRPMEQRECHAAAQVPGPPPG